jgi:2-dehydropantoate 2-reductase
MFPPSPTIAIIGSGAVGGYYGARLAQHGHDVHFLLRTDYATVRDRGWIIRSRDGDFALHPAGDHAHASPATMPKVDLVVIALKATANDQFPALITPLLNDDTAILTLQNGLGNEEALANLFGPERILGGLAFTCINRTGPGEIHHMDYGLIRVGEFRGPSRSPRAAVIATLFNDSKIRCEVLDDLRYGRWEKLVWNIPFNGLGAALDLSTDRLLATETGVALVRQVMNEVIATAAAAGVELRPGTVEHQIGRTRTMGAYLSSMQIDRRTGRALEIEAIVGRPLAEARRLGVVTPAIAMINDLLTVVSMGR